MENKDGGKLTKTNSEQKRELAQIQGALYRTKRNALVFQASKEVNQSLYAMTWRAMGWLVRSTRSRMGAPLGVSSQRTF